VLSLNLRTCMVDSVYKIPCGENEIIPHPRLFASCCNSLVGWLNVFFFELFHLPGLSFESFPFCNALAL
jgi:hypothetical protein